MATQFLADRAVHYALNHPRLVTRITGLATLLLVLLAALPNFVSVPLLHPLTVDTDPENMLAHEEPVRLFHEQAKKTFDLNDIVVVGVVNESNPQGVFNKDSLERIYQLTEFAKTLTWEGAEGEQQGVVAVDMIAPSTVDNIEQGGPGVVNFSWLMPQPPASDAEALQVRDRAMNIPFLKGTLVSEDGKAVAIYLPITSKDLSWRVSNALRDFASDWPAEDQVYITGLPVAEDTFGVEMFIQMAISAPLAMITIFLLLWWFFKRLVLVTSPMIVAVVSAMTTMALLIISGNTIHIMSSMIPIFIMPIAVLDAIHILSEFFDRYPVHRDRRKTLQEVMHTLFAPMLFTTLTTMAGFLSLALTPIPPVQVFGLFVAIGVFIAWVLTMLFIPAYIMSIDEKKLEGYGHAGAHAGAGGGEDDHTAMGRGLAAIGRLTSRRPTLVVLATVLVGAVAAYGISLIRINDNPIKWFGPEHEIRVADRVLNEHFGGTYMAYLSLSAPAASVDGAALTNALQQQREKMSAAGFSVAPADTLGAELSRVLASGSADPFAALSDFAGEQMFNAPDEEYDSWDELSLWIDSQRQLQEVFKQPDTLQWMDELQGALLSDDKVGKINSLVDVVKTVHRELLLGEAAEFRIPDSSNAVGQTLITYQNSHRPQDLWHFVTPDYRQANLWMQLTSGDNRDMEAVIARLDSFLAENPAPHGLQSDWFGLTYINVAWQEKMVVGMLESFAGSFVVVLVMMVLLFRSLLFGLLSMIPLTLTVGLIYGVVGLIGKDYDMPVAILSALSLGLAVDYAIHFLARSREAVKEAGSWKAAVAHVFGEPARAISRNAIVLSAGFLPLLLAPLVPYQTVGIFIAAIILFAGLATLVIMPALVTLLQRWLFKSGV
ncbi:RND family transporter [Pseudomaricurvus sp. HS19]|uniref:efflux RND transporter permease subunit n=1 Tax=Pseudomaricurvus sp. HS19 TaxID=2692626 RepID=UPI001369E609|nr:MMPL family transporter [Pseudomaricurvus sp. HS19]MYM64105.1 MMPL family transporter [Pseudomaricurvus sp. HS19]